jgi:oligopeptide/dipeptide ABC transporter ATP-binding protein
VLTFTGRRIEQGNVEKIEPIELAKSRKQQKQDPLSQKEITQVRSLSGNLAWPARQTTTEIAHEIIVMYAGRIVERAPAEVLFANPLHPYTRGLIATLPDPGHRVARLPVIPGGVPDMDRGVHGCRFADRCALADAGCRVAEPPARDVASGHFVACFKAMS